MTVGDISCLQLRLLRPSQPLEKLICHSLSSIHRGQLFHVQRYDYILYYMDFQWEKSVFWVCLFFNVCVVYCYGFGESLSALFFLFPTTCGFRPQRAGGLVDRPRRRCVGIGLQWHQEPPPLLLGRRNSETVEPNRKEPMHQHFQHKHG